MVSFLFYPTHDPCPTSHDKTIKIKSAAAQNRVGGETPSGFMPARALRSAGLDGPHRAHGHRRRLVRVDPPALEVQGWDAIGLRKVAPPKFTLNLTLAPKTRR